MTPPREPASDASDASDGALLRDYLAGDPTAFPRLYERHRDWVVAVGRRFTGDADLALDLMQEAFAYLVRAAPRLSAESSVRALLYPVVKRLARDRRRREARRRPLEEAPEPSVLPGLDEDVREHFRGLGALQQEILALRFADDLALSEIADLLELPLGTVKSRLHNALRRLREVWPIE